MMKTSMLKTLAAALALAAISATAIAQDLKIGYVNSERVLREASPAKAAQAKSHDALMCIADGAFTGQEDRRRVTGEHWFKPAAAMRELFRKASITYRLTPMQMAESATLKAGHW